MGPMARADDFAVVCRVSVSDGMGSTKTQWQDGAPFKCLLTLDSSIEARKAEQAGVTSLFSGLLDASFPLSFHDVFRRVSDGSTFRVTSIPADNKTPDIASFAVKSFSAERHTLADG